MLLLLLSLQGWHIGLKNGATLHKTLHVIVEVSMYPPENVVCYNAEVEPGYTSALFHATISES